MRYVVYKMSDGVIINIASFNSEGECYKYINNISKNGSNSIYGVYDNYLSAS